MILAGMLRLWWWAACKARQHWMLERFKCGGYLPVDCWIPDDGSGDGGYFRGGILANHCLLWRAHRGQCLGVFTLSGERVRGGFRYTPEEGGA